MRECVVCEGVCCDGSGASVTGLPEDLRGVASPPPPLLLYLRLDLSRVAVVVPRRKCDSYEPQ